MLKNLSQLEVTINDRYIRLICDVDCPIEHVKEALFQFSKWIGQLEDTAKQKQQEQAESQEPKAE